MKFKESSLFLFSMYKYTTKSGQNGDIKSIEGEYHTLCMLIRPATTLVRVTFVRVCSRPVPRLCLCSYTTRPDVPVKVQVSHPTSLLIRPNLDNLSIWLIVDVFSFWICTKYLTLGVFAFINQTTNKMSILKMKVSIDTFILLINDFPFTLGNERKKKNCYLFQK